MSPSYLIIRIHEKNTQAFGNVEILGMSLKIIDLKLDPEEKMTRVHSLEVTQSTLKRYPKKDRPECNYKSKKH